MCANVYEGFMVDIGESLGAAGSNLEGCALAILIILNNIFM